MLPTVQVRSNIITTSDENRALRSLAIGYEIDYFEDMLFEPGSVTSDFLCFQTQTNEGVWVDECYDYYFSFEDNMVRFYVDSIRPGVYGIFNKEDRSVTIDPEHAEDPVVILHEMIHIYEWIIGEYPFSFMRDILFLSLYNDLKEKIPNLDDLILDRIHVIFSRTVSQIGGDHGILFYLKSLDLDLRLGYDLGTIFGYAQD
jgi:hypothetical protein